MWKLGLVLLLLGALGLAIPAALAQDDVETCDVVDHETEEVLPHVTLTWDSSFLCANAPDEGSYELTIGVSNEVGSGEPVEITSLELSHTTPRPRGQGPDATAEATGLPVPIAPGERASFTVRGTYELVETDEGRKANLHLSAGGEGTTTSEPFALGVNVHLCAPGASG